MSDFLAWFLIVEFLGLLGFPLAFFLFANLPDRGYCMAKALAFLLSAYLLWVLGLTGIVPNSPLTIAVILLAGLVAFGWLYYRRWQELEKYLRSNWRYVLVVEALFLAFFLAWAFITSESPAINHTEKPMDFAFLTSILRSNSFPPEDLWLAGHSISYYYFGHFMMALPMKLGGIASSVGYNLALATIPALVAIGSFGITYNLVRISGGGFRSGILFGALAPVLIVLVGNLEGVTEFIQVRGWGSDGFWQWVGIKGMDGASAGGLFPDSNWWWWRATRVIDTLEGGVSLDYTITEFPYFSFLLGDLHSHVLSLPFVLLALALGLNLLQGREPIKFSRLFRRPWETGALALAFGALAFINSWDFPVYAAILAAIFLTKAWADAWQCSSQSPGPNIEQGIHALRRAVISTTLYIGPLLALAVLLFLPFYLSFSSQVSGVLPYLGPGTRPLHFVLVIGLPAFLGLAFLWRQSLTLNRPQPGEAPAIVLVAIVGTIPLLLWLFLAVTWGAFTQGLESLPSTVAFRAMTVLPALAVAGFAGYCALTRMANDNQAFLAFPLLLFAAAAFLLAGADLFHLADFFGNRMNTVFKVYYQAWLLFGIVGAYSAYYAFSRLPLLRLRWKIVQLAWASAAGVLLVVAFYYPVGATLDRTGLSREGHDFKNNTLDGLAYIRASNRAEYEATIWLRDEAPRGTLVEAVGDDYTEYGRVSVATGQPAVLGWKGHEHQWRGTTLIFEDREEDVASIYRSTDPEVVRRLVSKYDIRYVFLGHRERATYGVSELAAADTLFETAFKWDDVIVYEWKSDSQANE